VSLFPKPAGVQKKHPSRRDQAPVGVVESLVELGTAWYPSSREDCPRANRLNNKKESGRSVAFTYCKRACRSPPQPIRILFPHGNRSGQLFLNLSFRLHLHEISSRKPLFAAPPATSVAVRSTPWRRPRRQPLRPGRHGPTNERSRRWTQPGWE